MPNPLPSTRSDARLNRQRILDAAREVLHERGFEAEILEFAERAGVGTGTVYRHFANKEGLVCEIFEEMVSKIRRNCAHITGLRDARAAIAEATRVGFEISAEYGQLAVAMHNRTAPAKYLHGDHWKTLTDVFTSLIQRGIDQGHFPSNLDVVYAACVWQALIVPPTMPTKSLVRRSTSEHAAATSGFFLRGLGCRTGIDWTVDVESSADATAAGTTTRTSAR
jgi:AcrR family transcriptional regulator